MPADTINPAVCAAYDVVTIGECMLRFSPKSGETLEQADRLQIDAAGSESSTSVALARLGLRVGWVSALPDAAVGRWVTHRLASHGVDVSRVVWTDDRVGTFFYEQGTPPRGSQVVYDRADSAVSRLTADQVDWSAACDTRLMHISGITPALSDTSRAVTERALHEMRDSPGLASMDINYRAKLWSAETAARTLSTLLPLVDVLISTASDIELLFGFDVPVEEMVGEIHGRFEPQIIVITLAAGGAIAWSETTGLISTGPHNVEQVDRLGAGDAFDAGFLYGFLDGNLQSALQYGAALAALAYSEQGDITWATLDEMHSLIREEL